MGRIRWIGVVLGCLLTAQLQAQTQLQTDEQTLRNLKMPTDAKGLIEYFEAGSLKEGDAPKLEALAKKLDSTQFREREMATKDVVTRGPVILPFLKTAMTNFSLEGQRRAEGCVKEIEARMRGDAISAAARVLAARKDPKGAQALFNYLPSIATDPILEEEVLASVGRLTVQPDKVDPLILNALKDPLAFRRNSAAYLVGRRGGADHRQQLRDMLGDKDAGVRQRVAEGLFGKRPPQIVQEAAVDDDKLLRGVKVDLTNAAVLEFVRKKTLGEKDIERLRGLVKDLGSRSFATRMKATNSLMAEGTKALPFLKLAVFDADAERASRAEHCLKQIRDTNNPAIPMAAARFLARPSKESPADAIRALLAYVPFADDENVEEEVITCLTILSLREPKLEPELVKALADANPIRRGAAAFVLGHVGAKAEVAKVQALLKDEQPIARLRAAQGILATRNKDALPPLVQLIKSVPDPYLPRVEEVLFRIAEEKGPNETIVATSTESRDKAAKAWDKWLAANQAKIDLTAINDHESYLGLVTICEYDNQVGNIQGQVWESSRGGAKRFNFGGVMGAMDAQTLPNGRILVAENNANRITERDTKGDIKWTYQCPVNPITVQRLPNGNTFIGSYNMVMEIRPDKTEVYRINPGPQYYMFGAHKAKNNHIVAITAQGFLIELDAPSGKQLNMKQIQTQGNWCSVELMPNGNYLVASMFPNNGAVREIDRNTGGDVWSKNFPGAFRATRLPNGNIVVASMTTRQVAEMDRTGAIRWSVNCVGRPWGIHYR
jgi:HEAT repeat protein